MSTLAAYRDFRVNLRAALDAKGVSQREFADKCKTSVSYINRVLCGRVQPSVDQADEMARAIGYRLADLLVSPKKFRELLLTTVA